MTLREMVHDQHDPNHPWTNAHRHPWAQGFDSQEYVVFEPYESEHTHDGARSALRQRMVHDQHKET